VQISGASFSSLSGWRRRVRIGCGEASLSRNDVEHGTLSTVATFDELREQAKQEISGQARSLASDDADVVEQAADLLAARSERIRSRERMPTSEKQLISLAEQR
jgi:hypothetical protein